MSDTHSAPEAKSNAADFLYGTAAIAAHLGIRHRQAEHLIFSGRLPAFKIGKTVCARRSKLDAAFEMLEQCSPPAAVRKTPARKCPA
jgi:hypothetical protein